jgi:rSAM/selenodomain-associated transferase 1
MDEGPADLVGSIALGIMCKAPSAGTSKTRLSPPLSRDEAAALARCFIADVANVVGSLPPELGVRGFGVFTPPEAQGALEGLLPAGFGLLAQRGEDLSERCANAVEDLLAQGCAGACLLNADSPTLPTAPLEAAVAALRRPGERVVLGPTLDGGYYLVGVTRPVPELFRAIAWSTGRALTDTETRAGELGLAVERLPAWYDVDDGVALTWLVQELLGDGTPPIANALRGSPAPRTRDYLSALAGRGEGPPPSMIGESIGG